MRKFLFLLLVFLCFLTNTKQANAQDIAQAAASYNQFVEYFGQNAYSSAYTALYQSFEGYMKVLNSNTVPTGTANQARTVLKNIYPYLKQAAYFYTSQKDQKKTYQFAQAYVELSQMPAMQAENLPREADYAQLARTAAAGAWNRMAATGAWNSENYEKAILFFKTYLSTGDTIVRKEAYVNLGISYSKLNNYTQARLVLEEALRHYPNDTVVILSLIEVNRNLGDSNGLETYLPKAIALLQANDKRQPTLLTMLGDLQEKKGKYEQAAQTFEKLKRLMPRDLNTARHLAQSYYNAGIQMLRFSVETKSKKESDQYRQRANAFFRKAEPELDSVMHSDPLSVKYAFALATVYSCLGEQAKLKDMNDKIAALGYNAVGISDKQLPSLMAMNQDIPSEAVRVQQPKQTIAQNNARPSVVQQPRTVQQPQTTLPPAIPDVDVNIPVNPTTNDNTFAVIISNEKYSRIAPVQNAANDGRVFAEYCQKVLGLPKHNVRTYSDATALDMNYALSDIKSIAESYGGNLNVIFYYSGHGIPDEATKDAYLLPTDADGKSTFGLLSLNHLYDELASMNARCVTVFLDACFSGSVRGDGMILSARGVARKPRPASPKGNMVVFSAATDAETAMPYNEKQHGLFTYFLLKKLQETKGDITLDKLGQYLNEKVKQQSVVVNRKPQTPTVTPSPTMRDNWKKIKLM